MANKNESKSLLGKIWRIKWWLLSIFTVLFLLFALFFPLNNYYVELPGGAFDTKEVLTVDKKLMIQKDPTILWQWPKPRRL